jgi:hypothetical protein
MDKKLNIVLERGEAKRSIFDMTPEEIREVSEQVFHIVKIRAAEVGQLPVVTSRKRVDKHKSISF